MVVSFINRKTVHSTIKREYADKRWMWVSGGGGGVEALLSVSSASLTNKISYSWVINSSQSVVPVLLGTGKQKSGRPHIQRWGQGKNYKRPDQFLLEL